MTYAKLIEFCELLSATNADTTELENHHVKPDGYIAITFARVLDAIRREEDFDFRAFISNLIGYTGGEGEESDKSGGRILH